MRYFQCSKCKTLSSVNDVDCYVTNKSAEPIDWTVNASNLSNEVCNCNGYNKHMREFEAKGNITAQEQYDHEVLQRAYIDGGQQQGSEPSGTQLMTDLGI